MGYLDQHLGTPEFCLLIVLSDSGLSDSEPRDLPRLPKPNPIAPMHDLRRTAKLMLPVGNLIAYVESTEDAVL